MGLMSDAGAKKVAFMVGTHCSPIGKAVDDKIRKFR